MLNVDSGASAGADSRAESTRVRKGAGRLRDLLRQARKQTDAKRSAALRKALSETELRPPWCPKGINPFTGMPLKPGQRLPKVREADEALEERCLDYDEHLTKTREQLNGKRRRYPKGQFPEGPQWELSAEITGAWLKHNFAGRRGDTLYFREQGDLSEGEWSQLLWDLDCWFDWWRKSQETGGEEVEVEVYCHQTGRLLSTHIWREAIIPPRCSPPPPLHEYLGVSRETWGLMAARLDLLRPGWRSKYRPDGDEE